MTQKKLSDLSVSAASTLGGTELLYCVQGGTTKYATPAQIKTYVNTAPVFVPSASVTLSAK